MLTWSLGCTELPRRRDASAATTSFAFLLLLVPEPVWKTSIGNCASWLPAATSAAADSTACAMRSSSSPRLLFARAATLFPYTTLFRSARGMVRPLTGKFCTARWVCAPHSASAGTLTSPMLSCSTRKELVMLALRGRPRCQSRQPRPGRATVCVIMLTHVRELQRPDVSARCALAGGWALSGSGRAAACPARRARTCSRAHPHRGAVAVARGGGRAATAGSPLPPRGGRVRTPARIRARASRGGSRQVDRGAHQPRRQGGRILRARAARQGRRRRCDPRARALRLHLRRHQ